MLNDEVYDIFCFGNELVGEHNGEMNQTKVKRRLSTILMSKGDKAKQSTFPHTDFSKVKSYIQCD